MACLMFVVGRADRFLQQRDRAHDLAAGAIAALVSVVLHKGRLHGVQVTGLADAFDGRDLVALVHHREREAAVHAAAIDVDRAGAALPVIAALLGAGEMNALAQGVEQGGARVEVAQSVVFAIDAQRDVAGAGGFGLILDGWLDDWSGRRQRSGSGENACGSQPGKEGAPAETAFACNCSARGSRSTDC